MTVYDNMFSRIIEYREKSIVGTFIDLVPACIDDSEAIVNLRNTERVRYFFSQTRMYDIKGQIEWFKKYKDLSNDLLWCIKDKSGEFLGTIRIYNVDNVERTCNQGAFAIDERYAGDGPYAVEALILSLDYCFDVLGIMYVYHDIKIDNNVMNSLSRRLGFSYVKDINYNGNEYRMFRVDYSSYKEKRVKIIELLEWWKGKNDIF